MDRFCAAHDLRAFGCMQYIPRAAGGVLIIKNYQVMKQSSGQRSAKFLRQRKFLLVLPLIAIPFMTLLFWSLGGGQEVQGAGVATKRSEGFNLELPNAQNPSDSNWNKLNYYDQADKDSAKLRKLIKSDPYYSLPLTPTDAADSLAVGLLRNDHKNKADLPPAGRSVYSPSSSTDSNETKVYQRLAKLDQQLTLSKVAVQQKRAQGHQPERGPAGTLPSTDVDRLEVMMHAIKEHPEEDPEMEQLSQLMKSLKEIQHPELVNEKIKARSIKEQGRVFAVMSVPDEVNVSALLTAEQRNALINHPDTAGFCDLGVTGPISMEQSPSIAAVIAETQTLVNGATVKMQLTEPVFINGMELNSGQFIYGIARLTGERLTITISSFRYQHTILPVALSVYDLDGLEGIFIPGAITRDVTKQSIDQPLQNMSLLSLNPSIGAQAATAGIETAKKIISKKTKQIKVTVKTGYQVLLRDKQGNL